MPMRLAIEALEASDRADHLGLPLGLARARLALELVLEAHRLGEVRERADGVGADPDQQSAVADLEQRHALSWTEAPHREHLDARVGDAPRQAAATGQHTEPPGRTQDR